LRPSDLDEDANPLTETRRLLLRNPSIETRWLLLRNLRLVYPLVLIPCMVMLNRFPWCRLRDGLEVQSRWMLFLTPLLKLRCTLEVMRK
ncbi:hypothetical protein U1Q18_046872, partial [Sarracenia purpurea var. burkii]